jgi:hypothetical protein
MGMMTAQQGFDKVGLFTETVVKRIIRVADKADYDTTFEGINWYYEAQRLCETLAADSDYTVDQIAVAMAHLSPRLRWSQNVVSIVALVKTGKLPAYIMRGPAKRARKALLAADPFATFGKRAKKTESFARNIIGDDNAVTVDTWILNVVGITEEQLKLVGVYDAVAHAYRLAAKRRGFTPAQLQAVTWIVVRGSAA